MLEGEEEEEEAALEEEEEEEVAGERAKGWCSGGGVVVARRRRGCCCVLWGHGMVEMVRRRMGNGGRDNEELWAWRVCIEVARALGRGGSRGLLNIHFPTLAPLRWSRPSTGISMFDKGTASTCVCLNACVVHGVLLQGIHMH